MGDCQSCFSATITEEGDAFAMTRAEIHLDRFDSNIRGLREYVGQTIELMVVVKADAYGHGAVAISRSAMDAGADHVAVYTVAEALSLRNAGIKGSIVVLGPIPPEAATICVARDITPCISNLDLGRAISAAAPSIGKSIPFHLEIDTGLTRYGILPEEALPLVQALDALPSLQREGLFTHFAKADEQDKSWVHKQVKVFQRVRSTLEDAGFSFRLYHVAASSAILDFPELHLDLVRCGIALYGYYPSEYVKRSIQLLPVMTLGSHLARVRTVAKGVGVSYGHDWQAGRKSRIGLVPFGYADGMPRTVQGRGHVLVRGRRAPVVGRVAMDQFMIDLSDIQDAGEGDRVTIIGTSGDEEITADDIAGWAGTISYDVLSGISTRVPRLYIRKGRMVAGRVGMTMEVKRVTKKHAHQTLPVATEPTTASPHAK